MLNLIINDYYIFAPLFLHLPRGETSHAHGIFQRNDAQHDDGLIFRLLFRDYEFSQGFLHAPSAKVLSKFDQVSGGWHVA